MKLYAYLCIILVAALALGACSQTPTESTEETGQMEPAPDETETSEDLTPGEIVASGVFLGRSGKPMAGARLVLGEVAGDGMFSQTDITLVEGVDTAVADDQGKFEFKEFTPGPYTIVYQIKGSSDLMPAGIKIRTLSATDKSIAPMLKNFELGKDSPYEQREWGKRFMLMEGHTLLSEGKAMRIWNATVRSGAKGPYLEIRRNKLWMEQLEDGSEINLEAWSF